MELIVISENKLKVMLTADDMRHYNLDCDTIDSDNAPARRAFRSILDDARAQTGFDTGKDRIFVQLYPGKAGGCEMFVTKLSTAKAEAKSPPASPQKKEPPVREHAYVFPTLSHLLMASRRLRGNLQSASELTECERSACTAVFYFYVRHDARLALLALCLRLFERGHGATP